MTFVDGTLSIPVELNAECQLSLAWREEGDPSWSHKEETGLDWNLADGVRSVARGILGGVVQ
jgi:hypothetical protein